MLYLSSSSRKSADLTCQFICTSTDNLTLSMEFHCIPSPLPLSTMLINLPPCTQSRYVYALLSFIHHAYVAPRRGSEQRAQLAETGGRAAARRLQSAAVTPILTAAPHSAEASCSPTPRVQSLSAPASPSYPARRRLTIGKRRAPSSGPSNSELAHASEFPARPAAATRTAVAGCLAAARWQDRPQPM
jgi:hypothetical protein